MGKQVHRITAFESRKVSHPVFEIIHKYWLTVKATDFPTGVSAAANAREPVGLNRMVYRDVRASHRLARRGIARQVRILGQRPARPCEGNEQEASID